jgi:hypothetical protein
MTSDPEEKPESDELAEPETDEYDDDDYNLDDLED